METIDESENMLSIKNKLKDHLKSSGIQICDSYSSGFSFYDNDNMKFFFDFSKQNNEYIMRCISERIPCMGTFDLFNNKTKEKLNCFGFKNQKTPNQEEYFTLKDVSGEIDPQKIIESLKKAFTDSLNKNHNDQSLQSQLEEMFPLADYGELEKIVSQLEDFEEKSKVTDNTRTGVVMDFIVDGQKYFLKATSDKPTIQREAKYLDDSSQFTYLRAITPKKKGTLSSENLEALITHDVRDNISLRSNDLQVYSLKLKEEVEKVAEILRLNPEKMLQNPIVTDMFNRALEHTYMRDLADDQTYTQVSESPMVESSLLKNRLTKSNLNTNFIKEIESHFTQYDDLRDEILQIHQEGRLIANYDPRSENIIYLGNNNRPLCDFGTARLGHEAFDLRLEKGFDPVCVAIYAHFRNSLEQSLDKDFEFSQKDIDILTHQTKIINYASAIKLAAFKASRNIYDEAKQYLTLSRKF